MNSNIDVIQKALKGEVALFEILIRRYNLPFTKREGPLISGTVFIHWLVKFKSMINRDGALISLWQSSSQPYTSKKGVNELFDVAIVGGGMSGISLGLQLQNAGKKCVILEAENIGFGTSGGTTAHLNTLLDTPYSTLIKNFGTENASMVAKSARKAISLIKSNIAKYTIECGFEETSAYLFSQDEKQSEELGQIHKACKEVGVKTKFIHELPIPTGFGKVLEVEKQAKFHPLHYLYAIATAFESAGGLIVQNCRVRKVEEKDKISVETSLGYFESSSLVYATHIPPGVNLIHLRCAPWRSYAMAVTLSDDKYPEGLIYDMYDPYHYYRTQLADGKKVLIVGGYDHKAGHEKNTAACLKKLESHIRRYFNVEAVLNKWSSEYFEPADGLPYIGHLPGASGNIYVATGYGGNGMIYSQVAALLIKDLILKSETPWETLFAPARIKPVAGFKNFISHNADVVKELVGKWFSTEEIDQFADLAEGDGKVVEYNGHSIALSRDNRGKLHAVSPVCTHLGCAVQWNLAEQSWDCPCHGARYAPDGKVLTGPADRDLAPIQLNSAALNPL